MLGSDSRKILPVISKGSRNDIVCASISNSRDIRCFSHPKKPFVKTRGSINLCALKKGSDLLNHSV